LRLAEKGTDMRLKEPVRTHAIADEEVLPHTLEVAERQLVGPVPGKAPS
jgi:hypothetical protein